MPAEAGERRRLLVLVGNTRKPTLTFACPNVSKGHPSIRPGIQSGAARINRRIKFATTIESAGATKSLSGTSAGVSSSW